MLINLFEEKCPLPGFLPSLPCPFDAKYNLCFQTLAKKGKESKLDLEAPNFPRHCSTTGP